MSDNGHQGLKIYVVTNKVTGQKHHSVSDNAQDACKQADWPIGDCFVVEQKPQRKAGKDEQTGLLVKIPCQVCPFQYAECKKPAESDCPVQPNAPELTEWLKQAAQAHLCDYYGQELSHTDYQLGQKWLPMEKAIEELSHHH